MARLGKRERERKRDLIRANLKAGKVEVSQRVVVRAKDGTLEVRGVTTSLLSSSHLAGRTHVGFRNPQNARGSQGSTKRYHVWSNT